MAMQSSQIQKIVEGAFVIVGAQKLHSTSVALSDEPDTPETKKTVQRPVYIVGAIMTKEEFFKFRTLCNALGVWIKQEHWPLSEHMDGPGAKWEYSITASESWGGPIIRSIWPFLLAAGITATYLISNGYIRI